MSFLSHKIKTQLAHVFRKHFRCTKEIYNCCINNEQNIEQSLHICKQSTIFKNSWIFLHRWYWRFQ